MNPRRLDQLIHILKPVNLLDEDTGQDEVVDYLRHHRKVPAAKEDVSGGVGRRGLQVEASVKTVFTIRYIEDIQSEYRVEWINPRDTSQNKILELVAIVDRDGGQQWLELHCSEVA